MFTSHPCMSVLTLLVLCSLNLDENKADGKQQGGENRDGLKLLPFEFVALEACLEAACSCVDNEEAKINGSRRPVDEDSHQYCQINDNDGQHEDEAILYRGLSQSYYFNIDKWNEQREWNVSRTIINCGSQLFSSLLHLNSQKNWGSIFVMNKSWRAYWM